MVTDEMVEKAERVYWDTSNDPEGSRDMRAALEAALSAAEPVDYQLVFSDGRTSRVLYSKDEADRFKKASDITVDIRALYAAPPAPSMAVKALEWIKRGDDTFLSEPLDGVFRYHVWQARDGQWFNSADPNRQPLEALEAAKSVCQDDYEARIRSALSAQVQDVAGLDEKAEAYAVSISETDRYEVDVKEAFIAGYKYAFLAAPAKQEG